MALGQLSIYSETKNGRCAYFCWMDAAWFLQEIKRIKAIADIGLLFTENEYDIERFTELRQISYRLLNGLTGLGHKDLEIAFPAQADYPTAKVDIRGLTISEDKKILLVRELADGKWSLPGGWADIGHSPGETVVKETREETGLVIEPQALMAVFDTRLHPHPPEPFYVYKLVFYCKLVTGELSPGFDALEAGFFNLENLPPLSENRILKSQLELVYHKAMASDFKVYFD